MAAWRLLCVLAGSSSWLIWLIFCYRRLYTSTLPTEAASLPQLQLAFEEEQVSSALFCTIDLCYTVEKEGE